MEKIAFLLLLSFTGQITNTSGQIPARTYKAAVVEYYPIQNRSAPLEDLTGGNVDEYIALLDSVSHLNLDIVVYPESTITAGAFAAKREDYLILSTLVPTSAENITPCTTSNEYFSNYFRKLSCAARTANTYLVANLMEKSPCSTGSCAGDNWNLYNTNVVFDRSGKVIAKYRKFNLFGEYPMNKTEKADITVFTTDFGVTFGTFTCFDLLFENPALKLVRQRVNHIIFPTMWFSELPFLTALQAQDMWTVENNVVFLSAGANNPSVGSGGTGIFMGRYGSLVMDIIGTGGSNIYVRNVSIGGTTGYSNEMASQGNSAIDELALQMDDFYFKLDDLSAYASSLLNLSSTLTETTVCHEEFCCNFNIKLKNSVADEKTYYQYHLVAFSGVRYFSVMYGGVDVCGLVACTNSSLSSCGTRFPVYGNVSWPIRFEEITISGKFVRKDQANQFPNTLLSSIRPLNYNAYEWTSSLLDDGRSVQRNITLLKAQNRLMTFGIYGRDVDRDHFESSAPLVKSKVTNLAALVPIVAKLLSLY